MAQYIVINEHAPNECGAMEAAIPKLPPKLKGTDFYCTCPGGVHGYFMILEGDSAQEVLALLPEELKLGLTKALVLETFKL
ncbi:MAG: hypothetical protein ABR529_15285 [Actinomycetota bacterium]